MLEKETSTFESFLPQLLKTEVGKFALIKDDQLVGVYKALIDALKAGYGKFKDQPFLVRQIELTSQPLNFTNYFFIL